MTIKLISIVAGLILLCASCNPDEVEQPASNDPKNGSTWVFKQTHYNEAGTVLGTTNFTLKGVEVTINGSTWLNLVEQTSMNPLIALQKRSDGWWYISYPNTTPSLWYKNPATVNETYAYTYGTCIVKGINESVVVPAGTFAGCTYVEGHDSNSLEDEFWFNPNGAILIKFKTYDEKAAGPASNVYRKEEVELVSFTR